jgi:hypothetical protein
MLDAIKGELLLLRRKLTVTSSEIEGKRRERGGYYGLRVG